MPILNWVKQNKLATLLLLILVYFLFKNILGGPYGISTINSPFRTPGEFSSLEKQGISLPSVGSSYPNYYQPPVASAPEVKNRLVVQESYLSLLVKNVAQSLESIKKQTVSLGGYMVESNLSSPQEAASGYITVRVPEGKLEEALNSFRSLGMKVVSENLKGTDVTDQYVDIEARLKPLQENKTRFEEIMKQATKIEDILRIQQEIISLQTQIDNLRGQQNYLEKTAQMSKITIYLSTDELSLPYAPSQPWRPSVVFKHAIRSMLGSLQKLGSLIIWVAVYSVIWLPILGLVLYVRSHQRKSFPPTKNSA